MKSSLYFAEFTQANNLSNMETPNSFRYPLETLLILKTFEDYGKLSYELILTTESLSTYHKLVEMHFALNPLMPGGNKKVTGT